MDNYRVNRSSSKEFRQFSGPYPIGNPDGKAGQCAPRPAIRQNQDVTEKLILEIDGPVATITNNNTAKHNAFDDDMDAHLFAIFDELIATPSVRAVIWRG